MFVFVRCVRLVCRVSWIAVMVVAVATVAPADEKVRFNRDIRPLLADRCFHCHGPDKKARKGELRLDLRKAAVEEAIEPGDAEDSELFLRITSDDPEERMPPPKSKKPPLSNGEIELFRRWITEGAEYEPHWVYIPPKRPAIPAVKNALWATNPIDRFILARLDEAGLRPSPEADRVTLIRRVCFDLTGLPPSSAAVESFVADARPDAFERLVNRLLASPAFAERMAAYWLDLVRYADTVGYHGDQDHNISPYRDWILHALRSNMPFDQFTREQLAGNLMPGATEGQKIASGYNRLLQTSHEGGVQAKEYLSKYAADRVRNVSNVWMGATMGCAECHEHKFDPYAQKDFYAMKAFFADVEELGDFAGARNSLPTQRKPELDVLSPIDRGRIHAAMTGIARMKRELESLQSGGGNQDRIDDLKQRIAGLEKLAAAQSKAKRRTMITVAMKPRTTRVLNRGDWMDESGEIVEPAVPQFLKQFDTGGRRATRLDLARWLTAPENPQTSRAFVNRLWYQFFGVGISNVLDDLGSQGDWPTHPKLLDWLAVEFVESGWDVKHIVRGIVTSSVYRQASLEPPDLRKRDPENRLFARQSRFRLPAETIRDNG